MVSGVTVPLEGHGAYSLRRGALAMHVTDKGAHRTLWQLWRGFGGLGMGRMPQWRKGLLDGSIRWRVEGESTRLREKRSLTSGELIEHGGHRFLREAFLLSENFGFAVFEDREELVQQFIALGDVGELLG